MKEAIENAITELAHRATLNTTETNASLKYAGAVLDLSNALAILRDIDD